MEESRTDLQWGLKHDPYCCADMDRKEIDDVIFEINNFTAALGGGTIVTPPDQNPLDGRFQRCGCAKTGLNIVAVIRTLSGEI